MDREPNEQQKSRENMLAISLVIFVSGMLLFFLYMISFGIVGNVLAGGALMVFVGSLHYLIWGRAFSDEVAAERAAMLRKEALEEDLPRVKVPTDAIQDLSRNQGIQKKG